MNKNDYIKNLIDILVSEYKCSLLRDEGIYLSHKDIDLALKDETYKSDIIEFFTKEKFTFLEKTSKLFFEKETDGSIIIFDIAINLDYLTDYFYDIYIKKEIQKAYFEEPHKYDVAIRTLRYILFLRGKGEYLDFFYENKEIIEENNFFLDYLNTNPFKSNINFDILVKILKKDKRCMFKYIKLRYFLNIVYAKIKFDMGRILGV